MPWITDGGIGERFQSMKVCGAMYPHIDRIWAPSDEFLITLLASSRFWLGGVRGDLIIEDSRATFRPLTHSELPLLLYETYCTPAKSTVISEISFAYSTGRCQLLLDGVSSGLGICCRAASWKQNQSSPKSIAEKMPATVNRYRRYNLF